MNREAIIQAAIDADAAKQTHLSGVLTYLFTEHDLVKFAEIIRSATKEEDAKRLEESADRLLAPKRTNEVDRHTAFVLQGHASAIRASK